MGVFRTLGRGIALRCPNCGKGRIFSRFFEANDACPECSRVFQRDPGDWTGGAEMTMLLFVPIGVLLIVAINSWFSLPILAEALIVLGTVAVVMPFVYRHVKGLWLGILRAWEGPNPQPNPIRDPEWFTAFWDREMR